MAIKEFHSGVDLKHSVLTPKLISPGFTSGQQIDNANPTGLSTTYMMEIDTEYGGQRLTGVTAPSPAANGQRLIIFNSDLDIALTIVHEHNGSSTTNRFRLPTPVLFLPPRGSAEFIHTSGGGGGSRWHLLSTSHCNSDRLLLPTMFDDFFGLSTETGEIGELGWSVTNGSVAAQQDNDIDTAGFIRRTSGTTAAQVASMVLGGVTAGSRRFDNILDIAFRVKLPATNADFAVRFGFTSDAGSATPVNGVYFERLSTDTSFFGVSRNASAENRTAALLAQDTAWHTFRVARANGSNLIWIVDEQTTQTVQTPANIPDAADVMLPFLHIVPTTTTARSLDIDYVLAHNLASDRK